MVINHILNADIVGNKRGEIMNFVRFKGKYVDLSTIDINENIDTYANFFSKAFGKTEEEIRKILTDYKANSFLAILEKNEENF